MITSSIGLAILFMTTFANAQPLANCAENSPPIQIETIQVTGNKKTKLQVILNELNISTPESICDEVLYTRIARLRSTGLFTSISHEFQPSDSPTKGELLISVEEKWTTIPVLKFNSGGGINQTTLGVYDPNLFGDFLEAGAQYENLGGTNSGVVWFKNPRLYGERQGLDIQYWNTKRIRIKYNQDALDREIKQGFLHEREKIYTEFNREIANAMLYRLALKYNNDKFSTEVLPQEVIEKNGQNSSLPVDTQFLFVKAGLEYGAINGEAHSLSGQIFNVQLGYAQSLNENAQNFTQVEVNFSSFHRLTPELQFGQRFLAATTSTNVLQYWNYLGGLDRIRGFADNRFSGRQFILSNSELRYLVLTRPSARLQAVSFIDLASIGENIPDMFSLRAGSAGAGLRLILPRFYRFILRFDYAKPLIKRDDSNLSFGVQQFF